MEIIYLDTDHQHRLFEEKMAMCSVVEYDLDEYAAYFFHGLNHLMDTPAISDIHHMVDQMAHEYSKHRSDDDALIFITSFSSLFTNVAEQLLRVPNFRDRHFEFAGWNAHSMVVHARREDELSMS